MTRWFKIILITLLVKITLIIFVFFANSKSNVDFISTWNRWDGPHYVDIAQYGYQVVGEPALFIVFYPLYPILIWLSHFITNSFQMGAILISTLLAVVASIALFELTLLDFNRRIAFLAVWFLNIFPTAYFLQAPYTESLFLATSLITIYLFRKKLFLYSGLAGALTSLTRVNGILLLPTLLMETKSFRRGLVTLLLTPLGFLSYLFINYLIFQDPFHFSKVLASHWYKYPSWPWISIRNLINFYQSQTGDYYWLFFSELISIFLLVIATIFVFIKVRKSYGVYMFFNLVLFTSTSFIMSTPRYTLILFPIYIALALIKNKFLLVLISIVFLSLLFVLTYLYTQGRWAY